MRKNAAPKRPVVKDPVYGSEVVTQLVNKVLWKSARKRPAPIRF